MKYGFVVTSGDARAAADLSVELERAGWDGVFVAEPVWGIDAWVTLTACAMVTERIRLGTMLTPPSRMRPWKLASETATLDNLSGGRVILAVGLGAPDAGFPQFGETVDRKQRAELLDESLTIIEGLWRGTPFNYEGKHYKVDTGTKFPTGAPPPPLQQPRIPIWVVGAWPSERSMARAARYDGLIPQALNDGFRQMTPDELREAKAWIDSHRTADTTFDIVIEGVTPIDDPKAPETVIAPYKDVATWYIESMWSMPGKEYTRDDLLARARKGPPRID